jgi:hypothetical protein
MGIVIALSVVGMAACGGGERQDEDEQEGEFPVEVVSAEFAPKQRLAQTSELTLMVRNSGDESIPDLAVTVFTDADTDDEGDEPSEGELGNEETTTEESSAGEEDSGDDGLQDGGVEGGTLTEEDETDEESSSESSESEDEEETTTDDEEPQPEAQGAFSVISEQPDLAIPSRPVWILEQGYPRLAGTSPGRPPPGEISGAGGAEAAQTNTFSFGELEPGETATLVWRVTPVQPGTYTVHYRLAAGLQGKAVAVTTDGGSPDGEFVVQISDVPPQTRVDESGNVVPIRKGDIIGQAGTEEQKAELKK